MKKIGIVGGVGWPSTVDYYTEICRQSERRHLSMNLQGAPSILEMSIESLDLRKAISYLGVDGDEKSWSHFDEYHRAALHRLEASGAEFALMASNSPHHRYSEIVRDVHIPVIDIFETTAKETNRISARHVLILGTSLTMRSMRFREVFAKYGVTASGPQSNDAIAACFELISELQLGRIDGAAKQLDWIVKTCFKNAPMTDVAVCLACTELPLALPGQKTFPTFKLDGVTYINTTALHIAAAFDFAMS